MQCGFARLYNGATHIRQSFVTYSKPVRKGARNCDTRNNCRCDLRLKDGSSANEKNLVLVPHLFLKEVTMASRFFPLSLRRRDWAEEQCAVPMEDCLAII